MNSKIDHIAILVDDLDVAEKWYSQKLKWTGNFPR